MKDKNDVISEFNDLVNMTAAELEKWLKSGDSQAVGWSKEDDGGGESVGHDSGRKIVQILKDNPQKSPDKYTDDQIQHMRKVVSYCKRHLAQESKTNDNKSAEEVKKTKSYASLKNWGHDPLKEREGDDDGDDDEDADEDDGDEDEDEDAGEDDEQDVGTKRASKDNQDGENKRQKTDKSASKNQKNGHNGAKKPANKQDTKDDAAAEQDSQPSSDEDDGQESKKTEKSDKNESSGKKEPKKGDTVSWEWGQGQPEGTVKQVKHEKASVTTKKGNTVSRDGTEEDPAVVIDAGSSKAVKLNHELN
ncbi:DNA-binding protein [Metarhizium guizhouense ARSEF 977]|uniref:DNA-binding protein n=1 Tax=Metarhizium guizhouense (strain ARSEF 977) TaxID=1276136 RepID=A0A0B4GD01_METGA|nr:DNA-binding protein [Metarhizium guizhouense ARSEF 977]